MQTVLENNDEIKAVQANINEIKGKIAELERVYSCYFAAGVNYLNDQTGQELYLINIDKFKNTSYSLALNKQFKTGAKVSFGAARSIWEFDGSHELQNIKYSENRLYPFLSLEQSLLKDLGQGAMEAGIAKTRAQAKSALYLLEYKKQGLLFNAKMVYWKMSYFQTIIEFKKTSLGRMKNILEWNERRYKKNLIDEVELLESQASVKMKELDLKMTNEDMGKAKREFFLILNASGKNVEYELEKVEDQVKVFSLNPRLEKRTSRFDVLAAMENVKSVEYDQISFSKGSGADLVFNGSLSFSKINRDVGGIISNSDKNAPTYSIGLKYILPLDFNLRKKVHDGYESAKIAADRNAVFIAAKENDDWISLNETFNNARERLATAYEIKNLKRQKVAKIKNIWRMEEVLRILFCATKKI
jgi:outer membrane protein TolC